MSRPSGRAPDQLRPVRLTRRFTKHAEGSVLIEFGDTHVLCTASVEETVPPFLRGKAQGWVTAEYGMLPRSTHTRSAREAAKGKQSGRTQEIQRLIGRSLRAVIDLKALGERTITLDCDVLQADGGTRTAAITGAYVALVDAIGSLRGVIDLKALGERTITLDCDVLQADGGTRTASITGAFVALSEACDKLVQRRAIAASPLHGQVAAVAVGI